MKKGFVFIETIIVLMIVTVSLTLLFASYTLIKTKSKEKEFYDKISDKYLLYAISNLGTTASYNYGVIADTGNLVVSPSNCDKYDGLLYLETNKSSSKSNWSLTAQNCTNHVFDKCPAAAKCDLCQSYYNIFSPKAVKKVQTNTSSFTKEDTSMPNCKKIFTELNVVKLYVIKDVDFVLNSKNATSIYDNGTLSYLKTLKKCYDPDYMVSNGMIKDEAAICEQPVRYLVGVFKRYGEYYFASIEI